MAPGIHPPCTPSASCQPPRCHPTPPPCPDPEECLRNTIRAGVAPCRSAVSIMATRSKAKCGGCGKFHDKNAPDPRSEVVVQKYLKRKSKEASLKRRDMLEGSHTYLAYSRSKGTPKASVDCCAGHGHRGRVKRQPPPKKKKKKGEDDPLALDDPEDPKAKKGKRGKKGSKNKNSGCTIL